MTLWSGFQHALKAYLQARGVRSRYVALGGRRLHYLDLKGKGGGAAVLLVHGLAGNASGFSRIILTLGERFSRVVAPDLPGHGFSDGAPASTEDLLTALQAFAEGVVGPSFVVGNSLGGALAVALAGQAPASVRGLGLVAPAGARVGRSRLVETLKAFQVHSAKDTRAILRRLYARPPLPVLLLAPVLKAMYQTPEVQGLVAEWVAEDTLGLEPEVLSGLTVPTLVLWGEQEKLLPAEGVAYFRQHLPAHAQVRVVEGFGHVPQVERPRELARLLVEFAERSGLL